MITKVFHEFGLKGKQNRTYHINENCLDNINSELQAYCLGFLSADGSIYSSNGTKQDTIQIAVQRQDEKFLHALKTLFGTNKPLKYFSKTLDSGIHYYVNLQISSNHLASVLRQYNMNNHNTGSFRCYLFEEPLMKHYLRGYFDGDGSIYKNARNCWGFSISGYYDNVVIIQKYLNSLLSIGLVYNPDKRTNNFGQIRTSNQLYVYKLLKYLYSDCEYYLDRKYNKAQEFIEFYTQNILQCRS